MSEFGKVAILAGGDSSERVLSLSCGESILGSLERQGVEACLWDPATRPLTDLLGEGVTRAFLALFGRRGEDGVIQGALEMMNIPYTGSGVLASATAMNKVRTKEVWRCAGLRSAQYREYVPGAGLKGEDWDSVLGQLGGCALVKPATEGSSLGIHRAETAAQLQQGVESVLAKQQRALVERFIHGRELTVAVVHGKVYPPSEVILANSGGFNDFDSKTDKSKYTLSHNSSLTPEQDEECREMVARAVEVLDVCDVARADLILGNDGKFYLLEVNTCPNMHDTSSYLMNILQQSGVSFDDFVMENLRRAKLGKY